VRTAILVCRQAGQQKAHSPITVTMTGRTKRPSTA
jgi:hypothetical protein